DVDPTLVGNYRYGMRTRRISKQSLHRDVDPTLVGTTGMGMRTCRISKQSRALLWDVLMVLWLLGPISEGGSNLCKRERRRMSRS
ncbi:hypothetical protein AVEN_228400-1, partial [Araneus ventricosus]